MARKKELQKLICVKCQKEQSELNFYTSYSKMHTSGRVPYCKSCLQEMLQYGIEGKPTEDSLKQILQAVDKPFIRALYEAALNDGRDFLGMYMKNANMVQYHDMGWQHSEREIIEADISNESEAYLVDKWGNYPVEELRAFEKKYQALKNNYPEKTAMHTEALLKYIRYSCKEELATQSGDGKSAKMWADLANTAATAAKINPNQLSAADLAGGLNSFGELMKAVEQAVDIIPILPQFKFRPHDALDFIIWCYVNYIRDLKGLPACEYEDVYKFYDRKKKEYVDQYGDPYGIFTNDTTENNRDNINKFIDSDKKSYELIEDEEMEETENEGDNLG